MPNPFVILSLPRSRTAWLANFLSYEGRQVGHDISIWCDEPTDFVDSLCPNGHLAGTVETGAVLGWRLLIDRMPNARFIALRRPIEEIIVSLNLIGWPYSKDELVIRNTMLDSFAMQPNVRSIESEQLSDPDICKSLFNELLGEPLDVAWFLHYRDLNIQINLNQRFQQIQERSSQISHLVEEISRQTSLIGTPCSMN